MIQKDLRTIPSGRLFTLRIRRIPGERLDRIQALPGRFHLNVLFELILSVSLSFLVLSQSDLKSGLKRVSGWSMANNTHISIIVLVRRPGSMMTAVHCDRTIG